MKWDTLPDRFFTDADLAFITEYCRIETSMKEELQSRLETSANDWFRRQNSPEEIISPTVVKKTLHGLSRDAEALKERLKNIPDALWSSMIESREMVNPNRYGLGLRYLTPHHPEHGCVGEPGITVVSEDSRGPFQTIEISTIIEALGELADFADITPQINPPKNLSAQKILPLQKWVHDVHGIWVSTLGRKFTRYVDSTGSPVTDAARFCVATYKILDPNTEISLILNEMKKEIKAYNDFHKDHPDWKK